MSEIQLHAIMLSLKHAFGQKHFSICGVQDACDVAKIPNYTQHPHWATLRAMHCKKWEDIGAHRAGLVLMVAEVLGYEAPRLIEAGL